MTEFSLRAFFHNICTETSRLNNGKAEFTECQFPALLMEKDELSLLLEMEHIYFKTIVISHDTSRVRLTYG